MAIISKEVEIAQKDVTNSLVWFTVITSVWKILGIPVFCSEQFFKIDETLGYSGEEDW